jgi:PIN domain nuclease of toxin-antitoxin system
VIVLDTHALIWWAAMPAMLSPAARRAIAASDELGVCTISLWEISTLVRKRRLELDRPVVQWVAEAMALPKVVELPLVARIALQAGTFGDEFRGDQADRLIAATALVAGVAVVTKDRRLRDSPLLQTIW